jgi:WD40 repeat protein
LVGHDHEDGAFAVAFASEGILLASGSCGGEVRLWEREGSAWACRRAWPAHPEGAVFVALSPDGSLLATGGADRVVKIWDAATGDERAALQQHKGRVWWIGFSPDGQTLVSTDDNGQVVFWDRGGQWKPVTIRAHQGAIYGAAFSGDGKTLATAGRDLTVRLWDAATRAPKATLRGHTHDVSSVAFSADGRTLASTSQDGTVRLWDSQTGQTLRVLGGLQGWSRSVAFAPNGAVLAATDEDAIALWDVASGARCDLFHAHWAPLRAIAFSPDGTLLASAGRDSVVRLWAVPAATPASAKPGQPRLKAGFLSNYYSSVATPSKGLLASLNTGGYFSVWDIENFVKLIDVRIAGPSGERAPVQERPGLGVSDDFRRIVTSGGDKTLRIWEADGVPPTLRRPTAVLGDQPNAPVALYPDGKTVAAAQQNEIVRLIDCENGKTERVLRSGGGAIATLALSADGGRLAAGTVEGRVALWNLTSQDQKPAVLEHGSAAVLAVAFSPDGKFLVSGGDDRTVKLWNLSSVAASRTLSKHDGNVYALGFSPDGKTVVSAGGRCRLPDFPERGQPACEVKLWTVDDGRLLAEFEGHRHAVVQAAFFPDGKTLATVGHDAKTCVWDVSELLVQPRSNGNGKTKANR